MSSQFKFYAKTEETWTAMLQALREAKYSIDINHYIFVPDEIGDKFLAILKEKNSQGVQVRLLFDAVGSYTLYLSSIPEELRRLGIKIKFFNPVSPWRIHNFTSWFFRDHRKMIIIDRQVGFTGSSGIRVGMKDWRDTNARVEGRVAGEMSEVFEDMWQQSKDKNLLIQFIKWRHQTRKFYFITNTPYFKKRFLYHNFIERLRSANKSIWLTTPYFIPDRRLSRALRLAALRGVDVKIIVPNVIDVPVVNTASRSSFGDLLKNGVKIFKYQPAILHAKTAVVDGQWATFGSFNLDSLSFVYNFEANVVSTDKDCVVELSKNFLEDLGNSKEVRLEDWIQRPFIEKVREFFVAPLRGVL